MAESKELVFRPMKADEIECRVDRISEKGLFLLLYKNAVATEKILDEAVGPMNWQRHHTRDNANCIISIWDSDKRQWVEKEDTGTESFAEPEKGLASDSFKRSATCWGIGRELYTAPKIWVPASKCEIVKGSNGKPACYDTFVVEKIKTVNGVIVGLSIVNASKNIRVFVYTIKGYEKKQDN